MNQEDSIKESNKENNACALNVNVKSKPDLSVSLGDPVKTETKKEAASSSIIFLSFLSILGSRRKKPFLLLLLAVFLILALSGCVEESHALLKCKTCKKCFSETRGTVFFQLNTPEDEILRTIAMIPEKGGICGLARATGHSKDTICRWLEIAGTHSKEVTTYFLTNLNLNRVEVDEI